MQKMYKLIFEDFTMNMEANEYFVKYLQLTMQCKYDVDYTTTE